jgi:hypothetical protein
MCAKVWLIPILCALEVNPNLALENEKIEGDAGTGCSVQIVAVSSSHAGSGS